MTRTITDNDSDIPLGGKFVEAYFSFFMICFFVFDIFYVFVCKAAVMTLTFDLCPLTSDIVNLFSNAQLSSNSSGTSFPVTSP